MEVDKRDARRWNDEGIAAAKAPGVCSNAWSKGYPGYDYSFMITCLSEFQRQETLIAEGGVLAGIGLR